MITEAMIRAGVLATYRPGVCTEEDDVRAIFTAMIGAVDGEALAQQIANEMQRVRDQVGGDRNSFGYAEAAMRSELRAALSAMGGGNG